MGRHRRGNALSTIDAERALNAALENLQSAGIACHWQPGSSEAYGVLADAQRRYRQCLVMATRAVRQHMRSFE